MFCESCGSKLPEGSSFCIECGAPAPKPVEQPAAQPVSAPAPGPAPDPVPVAMFRQPVYGQPAQPVYQQPVGQQYAVPPMYVDSPLQQPAYYSEMPAGAEARTRNVFALMGMIFSFVSTFFSWLPAYGFIFTLPALGFSIVGLIQSKKSGRAGMAITGIIIGGIGTLFCILMTIFALSDGPQSV